MVSKGPKNRVRIAFWIEGSREAPVETEDGLANGSGDALRAVPGAAATLALEFGDGFQLAQGFGFDGFGFGIVVEDGFEFFFFAVKGARGLGVVQSKTAFLDSGAT